MIIKVIKLKWKTRFDKTLTKKPTTKSSIRRSKILILRGLANVFLI